MTISDEDALQIANEYLNALARGNAVKAGEIVSSALARGLSPTKVYLRVLMPSLVEVGELWHNGKLTVAEEHLASQITMQEMARIRQLIKPRARLGTKAVIASVEGDSHLIGSRVVADFLYMDGWQVDYLGTNTPGADLVKFVAERPVDLVGLSAGVPERLGETEHTIKELKKLPKAPKVIVGGPAIKRLDPAQVQAMGADGTAPDAAQAVRLARKVCGLADNQASMAQYLKGLGERILEKRKARHLTQQELADLANLDRAYISSVEHGKQNMTIGAIHKLSEALEIPLEELLVGNDG